MPTRNDILVVASREIGTLEEGRNIVKYWPALNLPQGNTNGWAWCAAFTTWVFLQCKIDLRTLVTWPYYCPNIVKWAQDSKRWKIADPRPGDLVLYSFTNSRVAGHIGIHERTLPGDLYQAIEGNTSPGNVGSQANGGGVYRRIRSRKVILGWVDMSEFVTTETMPIPTPIQLEVDGSLGPKTIRALQARLGVKVTGRISRYNSKTTKALQIWLNNNTGAHLRVDGTGFRSNYRKVGPTNTIRALQRHFKAIGEQLEVDGYLSADESVTIKILQNRLNRNTL